MKKTFYLKYPFQVYVPVEVTKEVESDDDIDWVEIEDELFDLATDKALEKLEDYCEHQGYTVDYQQPDIETIEVY